MIFFYFWNLINRFLIGAGLVIADSFKVRFKKQIKGNYLRFLKKLLFKESGLSILIGEQLKSLASPNKRLTLLIVMIVSAISTEFTSNMSMASVLLPIVDSLVIFFSFAKQSH